MTFQMSGSPPRILHSQPAPLSEASSHFSSSFSLAARCNSSKRKISFSSDQEHLHDEPPDTPLPPRSRSKQTPKSQQPKTPDSSPHLLAKKTKSVTGCAAETEARSIDNEAISNQDLREKKYTSPCGKPYARQGYYLENHKTECRKCKEILQGEENAAEVEGGISDLKQQLFAENMAKQEGGEIEEHMRRRYDKELDHRCHGADGKYESASKLRSSTRKRDSSEEISKATGNSPSKRSSSLTDEALPTEAEEHCLGLFRATTRSGQPLDLEDGLYLEGPPTEILRGAQTRGLELHHKLQEKLERKLTPKDEKGHVYVFSDPGRPHLYKIGRAKKTDERLKQIQYSCGLQLVAKKSRPVNYYVRTEGLVHAYLSDLRRPYICQICGKKHGEWFETTEEFSKASVEKWAKFVDDEVPYDANSKELQPFFRNLVQLRGRFFKDLDTETLRKDWDQILSPTLMDRFRYIVWTWWEMVWRFYWPVNAMIAWTVTFVVIQHPATFTFMAASVIGTFVTMARELHNLRHNPVPTKKISAR